MRTKFLLSLMLSINFVFGQEMPKDNKQLQDWRRWKQFPDLHREGLIRDTAIQWRDILTTQPDRLKHNNSRSSVLIIENKGAFERNIGQGQDLYVMEIDKMPCITPDTTYRPNMPGSELYRKRNFLQTP